MDNKPIKRCSTALTSKDMQLKTAIRYYFVPGKMVIRTKTNKKQEWMRM